MTDSKQSDSGKSTRDQSASKQSPRHGSAGGNNADQHPQQHQSTSQADGTAANSPAGEAQDPQLRSETPENREGRLNPSAPNDATNEMPANTTRDSAGEIGEPTGRGTLDAPNEAQTGVSDITGPGPTEKSPATEGAGDLRRQKESRDERGEKKKDEGTEAA